MYMRSNRIIGFVFDIKTISGLFFGIEITLLFVAWNNPSDNFEMHEVFITILTSLVALGSAIAIIVNQNLIHSNAQKSRLTAAKLQLVYALGNLDPKISSAKKRVIIGKNTETVAPISASDLQVFADIAAIAPPNIAKFIKELVLSMQIAITTANSPIDEEEPNQPILAHCFDENGNIRKRNDNGRFIEFRVLERLLELMTLNYLVVLIMRLEDWARGAEPDLSDASIREAVAESLYFENGQNLEGGLTLKNYKAYSDFISRIAQGKRNFRYILPEQS